MKINTIAEGLEDIRQGKVIIVVDDENRENEGDFVCAAEKITPEIINFMATHGRGLICTPIEQSLAETLDLPLMVTSNTDLHETAFTVSIDMVGFGCSTGISTYDRATGIKGLTLPNTKPNDYSRPGHIFPLIAKKGGVLRRTGHTEAAVDLSRMAGLHPSGVVVEIMNEDGTMARLPQLIEIAERFDMKIITIDDLIEYRMRTERHVVKEAEGELETPFGTFKTAAYRDTMTNEVHLALYKGAWETDEPVLTKVHSDFVQYDILNIFSKKFYDNIGQNLSKIETEGKGILLCMRHNTTTNNLISKIKEADKPRTQRNDAMAQREFGVGAQILREMNVSKLRLMTNNQHRKIGQIGYGLEVVEMV
jgi:3,4-dihydroxy 2-butanone 4-phosphate synthase / GTP cyclohydrolase II